MGRVKHGTNKASADIPNQMDLEGKSCNEGFNNLEIVCQMQNNTRILSSPIYEIKRSLVL